MCNTQRVVNHITLTHVKSRIVFDFPRGAAGYAPGAAGYAPGAAGYAKGTVGYAP